MTLPFPDRDTVASKFAGFAEADRSFIGLLMENAQQDESLLEGLQRYLDLAAEGRFLNTLKLEKLGEWLGAAAPDRLQIRLAETAKSSRHPAHAAFCKGLERSGGLVRAYPKV